MKNNINKQRYGSENHLTQKMAVYLYLHKHVATASMVTAATGIPQKSITRYKREFEKAGVLWEVIHTNCNETGYKAWYLTTNASKI